MQCQVSFALCNGQSIGYLRELQKGIRGATVTD